MVTICEDPTKHIIANRDKIESIVDFYEYRTINLGGKIEIYKGDDYCGMLYHWDTPMITICGSVEEFMPLAEKLEENGFNVTIMY